MVDGRCVEEVKVWMRTEVQGKQGRRHEAYIYARRFSADSSSAQPRRTYRVWHGTTYPWVRVPPTRATNTPCSAPTTSSPQGVWYCAFAGIATINELGAGRLHALPS